MAFTEPSEVAPQDDWLKLQQCEGQCMLMHMLTGEQVRVAGETKAKHMCFLEL